MIDGLPLSVVDNLGTVVVVVLVGWLVFRGHLIPRSTVQQMERSYEREIQDITHDRDEWRAAHRISEAARIELREQNARQTLEVGKTLTDFFAAFREAARLNTKAGGSHQGEVHDP